MKNTNIKVKSKKKFQVSTQSTSTDWQRSPISSDKAATLSRQLAKYAQRRGKSEKNNILDFWKVQPILRLKFVQ